jgi:hypothetical protein
LYGITFDGKLWRGTIDGNATELTITELDKQSLFAINNDDGNGERQFIITNEKSVFITNEAFEVLHSFKVEESIRQLLTINGYIVLTTTNQLYLCKNGEIIEGFPIYTDGFYNISDIDNNGKINIINIKHGSLYNYELATNPISK